MNGAQAIGLAFAALALVGIAYQLIALAALHRFFAREAAGDRSQEAVTLLKPLHGDEPQLVENLAGFLDSDHAGPLQTVFGVATPDDPATAAVAALRQRFPAADIALSSGPVVPGANAKMGNLAAMMPAARHPVLVLSDSDMVVDRRYLSRLLAALGQPGTGAVTCLYAGRGDVGAWSRISAAAMSYTGLPNMVMALTTGIAQPCLGSTIAMRRETLEAIGGFARFADVLADDYAIGEAVAALDLKVTVPPMVLTHACAHASWSDVWRQHLRWSATIRGVAPLRHAGSGITHALAFALLAAPFLPVAGAFLIALALAARWLVALKVGRISAIQPGLIWLLPVADLVEFAAFCASFAARAVNWRGERLTIAQKGRIAAAKSSLTEHK